MPFLLRTASVDGVYIHALFPEFLAQLVRKGLLVHEDDHLVVVVGHRRLDVLIQESLLHLVLLVPGPPLLRKVDDYDLLSNALSREETAFTFTAYTMRTLACSLASTSADTDLHRGVAAQICGEGLDRRGPCGGEEDSLPLWPN